MRGREESVVRYIGGGEQNRPRVGHSPRVGLEARGEDVHVRGAELAAGMLRLLKVRRRFGSGRRGGGKGLKERSGVRGSARFVEPGLEVVGYRILRPAQLWIWSRRRRERWVSRSHVGGARVEKSVWEHLPRNRRRRRRRSVLHGPRHPQLPVYEDERCPRLLSGGFVLSLRVSARAGLSAPRTASGGDGDSPSGTRRQRHIVQVERARRGYCS